MLGRYSRHLRVELLEDRIVLAVDQLTPIADASVAQDSPDMNFGALEQLHIRSDIESSAISYIEFDLSSIPPGSVINSASLELNVTDVQNDDTFNLRTVEEPWTETGVIYANRPGLAANNIAGATVSGLGQTIISGPAITGQVRAWFDGSDVNYGFGFVAAPDSDLSLSSREDTPFAPTLIIDFTSPEVSFRGANTYDAPIVADARGGDTLYLRVDAPDISDEMVTVQVFEDDGANDNLVATLPVTVQDGIGFVPWQATWQSDDSGDPFNRYYLLYDVPASSSDVYSGAPGVGHLLVKPPVQNSISGVAPDNAGDGTPVTIERRDQPGTPIETAVPTWIVTHGLFSNALNAWVNDLVAAIDDVNSAWQVLTVDWSEGASVLTPYWVKPVGSWVGQVLSDYGISGLDLNLVGHSWGSYVVDELAEATPGGVNSIVGLDPGAIPGAYSPSEVNFAEHSAWSIAFHSSDVWGNEDTPTTADASFAVQVSGDSIFNTHAHTSIHELFRNMISSPDGGVSRFFDPADLIAGQGGPWIDNRFNFDGGLVGNYEGVIATVDNAGLFPESITYIANGSGDPRTIQESDFLGDYNGNSVVDAADFVLWRMTSGSVVDMRADGSGNGVVDPDDYFAWRSRFGFTFGTGTGSSVEPVDADTPVAALKFATAPGSDADWSASHDQAMQPTIEFSPQRGSLYIDWTHSRVDSPAPFNALRSRGTRTAMKSESQHHDLIFAWLESSASNQLPKDFTVSERLSERTGNGESLGRWRQLNQVFSQFGSESRPFLRGGWRGQA